MTQSKSYSLTSSEKPIQLPLKGFRVPLDSDKPGWTRTLEGMGNGRYRVHTVKKR